MKSKGDGTLAASSPFFFTPSALYSDPKMLTIDKIKDLDIPINVSRKKNNIYPASAGLVLYNDSVNLYQAIKLVITELGGGGSSITIEDVEDTVSNLFVNSSTITFTYDDNAPSITATINLGAIDHDQLLNYVANEHIDHSTVSILSGTGLSGGGDLTATRTLSLTNTGVVAGTYGNGSVVPSIDVDAQGRLTAVAAMPIIIDPAQVSDLEEFIQDEVASLISGGTGITVTYNDATNSLQISSSVTAYTDEMAQDAIGNNWLDTSTINFTYNDPSGTFSAAVIVNAIDHDLLLNYSANEHIDHTAVSILAGTGMTGGGDLTTTRTLGIQDTGVVAGSYGDGSNIPSFTVNSQGQLTSATSYPVLIGVGQILDLEETIDDRVNTLLVEGAGITLTYNDAANTLTIASTTSGGNVIGNGSPVQVTYWTGTNTIDGSNLFLYDGVGVAINQGSVPIGTILSTQGTSTSVLFSGYVHSDSTGNPVFRVSDQGAVFFGAGLDPLQIDGVGISRGGGYVLDSGGGNITLSPGGVVHVESPMGIGTFAVGTDQLVVVGTVRIEMGSDATGDILYRTSSGSLGRLGIGSTGEVLTVSGAGLPSWQPAGGGSLPGGSLGDMLIHNGTTYVSISPIVETQTGITGSTITLASTPVSYAPLTLYRNGVYQVITDDYTISSNVITVVGPALVSSDKVTALYHI